MKKLATLTLCIALLATMLAGCKTGELGTIEVNTNFPASTSTTPPDVSPSTQPPATPPPATPPQDTNPPSPGEISEEARMSEIMSRAKSVAKSGGSENAKWPKSAFPAGFPVYPDGDIIYAEPLFKDDMMVVIAGSDKDEYEEYWRELSDMGWEFEPEEEADIAYKDTWMLIMGFDEDDDIIIYIWNSGFEFKPSAYDWPKNLPFPLPVYPEGKITLLEIDNKESYYSIWIEGSTQPTVVKYIRELEKTGWVNDMGTSAEKFDDYASFDLDTDQGTWWLSLMLLDGVVSIDVRKEYEANYSWPEDIPVPAYTDGKLTLVHVNEDKGFCDIAVDSTTQSACDSYKRDLISKGWIDDGKDDQKYDVLHLEDSKGSWVIKLNFLSYGELYIDIYFPHYVAPVWLEEWPQGLTAEIPVYPGWNEIASSIDDNTYYISIYVSSKGPFDKYRSDLISNGWVEGRLDYLSKVIGQTKWTLSLEYLEYSDGDAHVTIVAWQE